ncbi:MAG: hypothetical protein L0Y57_10615, partial [Beijerinckiaceae bacterium]|nr:hypothetical protein [Beijerinckiaceae bacterium]
ALLDARIKSAHVGAPENAAGSKRLIPSARMSWPRAAHSQKPGRPAQSGANLAHRVPGAPAAWLAGPAKTLALSIDHGLAALGIAAAAGSAAFAVSMVSQESSNTAAEWREVHGHLARSASVRAGYPLPPASPPPARSIDYSATGSIRKHGGRRLSGNAAAKTWPAAAFPGLAGIGGYTLSFVHKDMALVKSAQGYYAARPGMVLPNAGPVLSIERHAGKWFLVTGKAIIAGAD